MTSNAPYSEKTKKPRFFYGYIIVFAGFLVNVITYGGQYSFGVFFKPVLNEFGWSRAITSGGYALNMIVFGILGLLAGRLTDKFGPRPVVTVCGIFLGLGYILMSQIHEVWQYYLFYGVLAGTGMSTWVPLLTTGARWFVKRRGLTSGLIVSGAGIGTVITPPLANHLISTYNWRNSYIILGVMALVIIIVSAQLLKRDPGLVGLRALGADAVKEEKSSVQLEGLSVRETVRTRQFWIVAFTYFNLGFTVHTTMVHTVAHLTDVGIGAAEAAAVISVIGAVSVISKVGLGSAIDRIGGKRILIMSVATMTAIFLWVQPANVLWMFFLFAVVFAFGYGGLTSAQSPVSAQLFGLKELGAILGLILVAITIGGSSGPVLAGYIFDHTGSYSLDFWILFGLNAVNLVLILLLKPLTREAPSPQVASQPILDDRPR